MYAMDKHESRPSFATSQKPIDLTQSDDDDDLIFKDRRRLSNATQKPQSNGGLPKPFQFSGIRTVPSEGDAFNIHSRSNRYTTGPITSIHSTKRSRIVPSPAAKDQFRVGSASSLRPTVPSMQDSSTIFSNPSSTAKEKGDMGRISMPAAYTAVMDLEHRRKRRKTHDYKEVATSKSGGLSGSDAAGQDSRQYSLPRHSNTSNVSQLPMKSGPSTSSRSFERRSSSVSTDSFVTKTKQKTLSSAEKEESIRKALVTQICPRIRTAILEHFPNLDRQGREAIALKAIQIIGAHPTFIENLSANGWNLSAEYENHVSLWADRLVKQHTDAILGPRQMHEQSIENRLTRTLMSSRPSGIAREGRVDHVSRERSQWRDFDSDSSTAPSDLKDVSEEELVGRSGAPKRFYSSRSSSPPTSLTAESTTGSNLNEIGLSKDYEDYKLSVPFSRQAGVREITTRDDIATREVLGLRLAALDSNTPRPYISCSVREDIKRGFEIACNRRNVLSTNTRNKLEGHVLHIDFCTAEVEYLVTRIRPRHENAHDINPLSEIILLLQNQSTHIPRIIQDVMKSLEMPSPNLAAKLLIKRGKSAITAFLEDAAAGTITVQPQLLRLQSTPKAKMAPSQHPRSISSLLRERETWGSATAGISRSLRTFKTTLNIMVEDTFVRQGEWIDCCGDIFTISWTSDNAFICGATAHSDSHNMQYNKPGNLLVGSTSLGTLRAVPNHRIVRPVVTVGDNAENALQSMHRTQDPWLYTSVVSTSHSGATGLTFTASFDKTVKVWAVKGDGSSSELRGTWEHKEKVNFVVSSDHHELVATASDVSNNAIRVYKIDKGDISKSVYDTYTGDRAHEQAQELQRSDKWAYFPATIQWGRLERIAHLLLVGYSPRSVTGDDNDIPEDKKNTGELCLWNVRDGSKVPISTARTQNVFEVIWHPTQPIFLAATSPCGTFEPETRTQIHVFGQNKYGAFLQIKSLDCPAFDINELTIMPSSSVHSYVTASCTDGNTYVWDTAFSDDPIHVLGHGESLDNPLHDLPQEVADTGVKFASWGKTSDRLYTGSSDGVLKAWDIRAPRGKAFVRNVLSVSGGISVGAFSRDYTKLLLGDATGKVHLLALDDTRLEYPVDLANLTGVASAQNGHQSISRHLGQRPKPIIPHPEPEPPEPFDLQIEASEQSAYEISNQFLESKQLVLHPDRAIGAVQGPNYLETQFFRRECHVDGDWTQPILPEWQGRQQYEIHRQQAITVNFPLLPKVKESNPVLHSRNLSLDFDMARLDLASQQQLANDRVDLDDKDDYSFNYELVNPRTKVFLNRVE